MEEVIRGRVCQCGCGQELLLKDGSPDFSKRRFYSPECRRRDKALRVAMKRQRLALKPSRLAKADRRLKEQQPIFVKLSSTDEPLMVPSAIAAIKLAKKYPTLIAQMEIVKVWPPTPPRMKATK